MSSRREDFFSSRYYAYNRLFLTIVGLWPYQEKPKRMCYACFTVIMIISATVIQIYNLIVKKSDVKEIADLMQTFLPTLTFSLCYFYALLRIPQIKKLLDHIRSDWNTLSNAEELMVMQKYTDVSRICCRLVACTFYVYIAFLLFPSISCFVLYIYDVIDDTELVLPITKEAFMGNKIAFWAKFATYILMILVITTTGVAYYTTIIVLAQHACLLFNILIIKIRQRFRDDTCQVNLASSNTKADDDYQWIINIIKYHDYVVNYVDNCKSLCEGVYILQLFLALLLVILDFYYIFQILDMVITSTEAVKNSIFVVGNLCMIYATLFIGQRLIDHSIKAYTECRLISFYELSVETNKLLLQLTTRCMNPCSVSIGGMLVASNELFTKMTKASFSFATVFYNARKAVM